MLKALSRMATLLDTGFRQRRRGADISVGGITLAGEENRLPRVLGC